MVLNIRKKECDDYLRYTFWINQLESNIDKLETERIIEVSQLSDRLPTMMITSIE